MDTFAVDVVPGAVDQIGGVVRDLSQVWPVVNGARVGPRRWELEGTASELIGIPGRDAFLPSRHLFGRASDGFSVDDRPVILMCAECGDPACGAVAVRIEVSAEHVDWVDFVYGNTYEEPEPLAGRFRFSRTQYEEALRARS